MKRLAIALMAAALTLGLTMSLPASAEAYPKNDHRHHQTQGRHQNYQKGYHGHAKAQQTHGYGWKGKHRAVVQKCSHGPRHSVSLNWCPYR